MNCAWLFSLALGSAIAQAQVNPKDLVRQSIVNYEHDWQAAGMNWASTETDMKESEGRKEVDVSEVIPLAGTPYDRLIEMDEIDGDFPQTDVALVIGANDVTNPAARSDASSPIYGMPILDVDKAHTVMVIKRSMNPGFAGIDNPLYYLNNNLMLFGDAKAFVGSIVRELGGGHG